MSQPYLTPEMTANFVEQGAKNFIGEEHARKLGKITSIFHGHAHKGLEHFAARMEAKKSKQGPAPQRGCQPPSMPNMTARAQPGFQPAPMQNMPSRPQPGSQPSSMQNMAGDDAIDSTPDHEDDNPNESDKFADQESGFTDGSDDRQQPDNRTAASQMADEALNVMDLSEPFEPNNKFAPQNPASRNLSRQNSRLQNFPSQPNKRNNSGDDYNPYDPERKSLSGQGSGSQNMSPQSYQPYNPGNDFPSSDRAPQNFSRQDSYPQDPQARSRQNSHQQNFTTQPSPPNNVDAARGLQGPPQGLNRTASDISLFNGHTGTQPSALQTRPPYPINSQPPSQPPSQSSSSKVEVTIKTNSQISAVLRQLDEEGFFDPRYVALLPRQLEMRLKAAGIMESESERRDSGVGMPDEQAFGGGDIGGDFTEERGDNEHEGYAEGEGEGGGEFEGEQAFGAGEVNGCTEEAGDNEDEGYPEGQGEGEGEFEGEQAFGAGEVNGCTEEAGDNEDEGYPEGQGEGEGEYDEEQGEVYGDGYGGA